jgi:hypothetical protein
MAGRLREAALLQAVAFAAGVIIARRPWHADWMANVYLVLMLALLAGFVVWLVALALESRRGSSRPEAG